MSVLSGTQEGKEFGTEGVGNMVCAVCHSDLDHCHGTLVQHVDGGFAECTEPRCLDLDQLRHVAVVDCEVIAGGCDCALPVELDEPLLLRVS